MLVTGLLATIPLLFAMFAAQSTPEPVTAPIPPVVWELIAFTESGGAPVEIAEPARYTLQFLAEGELIAQFDCNQGRGTYTATDGVLALSPIATTRMLCPADSQDTQFVRILSDATSYELDADGSLVLGGIAGQLQLRPALTAAV